MKGYSYSKSAAGKMKQDTGCPIYKASNFEKLIHSILDSYNVEYECEYAPKGLPFRGRYDVYIVGQNKLIDCDGIHHFRDYEFNGRSVRVEDVLAHDNIKNNYAFDNNMKLLRIPYIYKDVYVIEKFIEQFLKDGVVMYEIIDFYSGYEHNNYAYVANKQNEIAFKEREGTY